MFLFLYINDKGIKGNLEKFVIKQHLFQAVSFKLFEDQVSRNILIGNIGLCRCLHLFLQMPTVLVPGIYLSFAYLFPTLGNRCNFLLSFLGVGKSSTSFTFVCSSFIFITKSSSTAAEVFCKRWSITLSCWRRDNIV